MSAEFFDRLVQARSGDRVGTRRLGSHSPPNPDQSRVKRALFGPVDHEENKRFFKREFDRDLKEKKRQYNFDFENEKALDGRWEWKKVAPNGLESHPSSLLSLEVRTSVSELQDHQEQCREIAEVPVPPPEPLEKTSEAIKEGNQGASKYTPEASVKVCDKTSVSKGRTSNTFCQSQRKSKMSGNVNSF